MMVYLGIILVFSYLVIIITVYLKQDSIIYFPEKEIWQTPKDIGLGYEEIYFVTEDGVTVSGWYIPAENEEGVLLFCHGNAGNISDRLDSIKIFNKLGLSVMIFDYRGYGKSAGKPSETGTYLDAEAAWEYLINVKQKPTGKILIFGRSLGAAIAAETALRKFPACLIVESSFTSVPDIGKKFYPWLPVKLISKFKYSTIEKISSIKCPKLIIHSPQDEIIPFEHGKLLFKKASDPKDFLEIKGGHNEGFIISGSIYTDGLKSFVDKCLNP
ncbi:MAG: lysophospholipase [Nitrospirae bacterium RBG_13_39_12]|nr:MAG: lysophospholipase [Nitrospirae bacterium RBG_13_39_12]